VQSATQLYDTQGDAHGLCGGEQIIGNPANKLAIAYIDVMQREPEMK